MFVQPSRQRAWPKTQPQFQLTPAQRMATPHVVPIRRVAQYHVAGLDSRLRRHLPPRATECAPLDATPPHRLRARTAHRVTTGALQHRKNSPPCISDTNEASKHSQPVAAGVPKHSQPVEVGVPKHSQPVAAGVPRAAAPALRPPCATEGISDAQASCGSASSKHGCGNSGSGHNRICCGAYTYGHKRSHIPRRRPPGPVGTRSRLEALPGPGPDLSEPRLTTTDCPRARAAPRRGRSPARGAWTSPPTPPVRGGPEPGQLLEREASKHSRSNPGAGQQPGASAPRRHGRLQAVAPCQRQGCLDLREPWPKVMDRSRW